VLSHSLQSFKKTLNLPAKVLKISITHLIATQKASFAGGYSEHVAILKCNGILVKKKEVKKSYHQMAVGAVWEFCFWLDLSQLL